MKQESLPGKALVVGMGSIGLRHARILRELGWEVSAVSRRKVPEPLLYATVEEALGKESFAYVVVANETCRHGETVGRLWDAGFRGSLLVEKPLGGEIPGQVIIEQFERFSVAYQLRFMEVLDRLRHVLGGQRLHAVQVSAGQFLPHWRPDRDHRETYSARADKGGGVLRDLSHELDYIQWLFGPVKKVVALGGRVGDVTVDTDDCWSILMETEKVPVLQLHLNYYDRPARREIVVQKPGETIRVDLVRQLFWRNEEMVEFAESRDEAYRAMHQAQFGEPRVRPCSFDEAREVEWLIRAIQDSARTGSWECRAVSFDRGGSES